MSFYDNFFVERSKITFLGKKMVDFRSKWVFSKIHEYSDNKELSLLEIGPGKGLFADFCNFKKIDYLCLEGNKKAVKELKKRNINARVQIIPPFNIKKRKFNVVYSNQVFEHMSDKKEAKQYVKESKSILSRGGIIVISAPEMEMWKSDFFVGDYTHTFPTSLINTKQILTDNGFSIEYENHYTLIFSGYLISKLISNMTHFLDYFMFFDLLISKKRRFKIKSILLPSFFVIARKK